MKTNKTVNKHVSSEVTGARTTGKKILKIHRS
jgi:hypothetical protein